MDTLDGVGYEDQIAGMLAVRDALSERPYLTDLWLNDEENRHAAAKAVMGILKGRPLSLNSNVWARNRVVAFLLVLNGHFSYTELGAPTLEGKLPIALIVEHVYLTEVYNKSLGDLQRERTRSTSRRG